MTFWKWSRTAATNGTADSTCPFPEGMAPSAINDGTRGMMAAAAKYRDDMSGAIVTGGSVNAYTVSSYQGFDTLAHLDGAAIAFSPHLTNTGAVQVNVDGLGLKPYRPSPGVDFIGGELILGTPYVGVYNHANGEIYARGFMTSPYAVPVFGGLDFWDTIAPNSCFIFPAGQAINRVTYAKAFARWGTTYGAGDGSTTFNVPDKTGRASVMKEASASRLTATYFGGNSTVMGAVGGFENSTIGVTHLPNTSFPVTGTVTVFASGVASPLGVINGSGTAGYPTGSFDSLYKSSTYAPMTATLTSANAATGGSGTPLRTVPPLIVCNYVIRIL